MGRYIVKRILAGITTVLLVYIVNFLLIQAVPGDPINAIMGVDRDDPEMRIALEAKYGFDKPVPVQLMKYIGALFHGDLGTSIIYNRPVSEMIGEKIGATLLLVFTAAILALLVGTAMGIQAARREGSFLDKIYSFVSYILNAVPSFWLGLMFIILFASLLHWFPSYGMTNVRQSNTGFRLVLDVLHHMFLPLLTLVLIQIPVYFRIAKTAVLQVTQEDFVLTLKAVGMPEEAIFRKYIFRNAILPTITIFGISMAYLITGVALIEIVFAWPGTGRLVLTAISQRDYPTLMGIYLVMSISVAVTMIIVDVVYALLDPRIRY